MRPSINSIVFILLAIALAVQTVRIEGFKVWPISVKGYRAEAVELRAELKRIFITRNNQRVVTTRTIERVRVVEKEADRMARRVETAPVSGQCRTPAEIMGAGL